MDISNSKNDRVPLSHDNTFTSMSENCLRESFLCLNDLSPPQPSSPLENPSVHMSRKRDRRGSVLGPKNEVSVGGEKRKEAERISMKLDYHDDGALPDDPLAQKESRVVQPSLSKRTHPRKRTPKNGRCKDKTRHKSPSLISCSSSFASSPVVYIIPNPKKPTPTSVLVTTPTSTDTTTTSSAQTTPTLDAQTTPTSAAQTTSTMGSPTLFGCATVPHIAPTRTSSHTTPRSSSQATHTTHTLGDMESEVEEEGMGSDSDSDSDDDDLPSVNLEVKESVNRKSTRIVRITI